MQSKLFFLFILVFNIKAAFAENSLNLAENTNYVINRLISLVNKITDKVSGVQGYCDEVKMSNGNSEAAFIKEQAPWNVCTGTWGWDPDNERARKFFGTGPDFDCVDRQTAIYEKGLRCFRTSKAP